MSFPPTFNEKYKLKSVSKERKCRSEGNYNYNYEFNRTESNEFKTIAYRCIDERKTRICCVQVRTHNRRKQSVCHISRTSCCSPPLHRTVNSYRYSYYQILRVC